MIRSTYQHCPTPTLANLLPFSSICLQDNSYVVRKEKDDPEEFKNHPDRIISSRMIEENFGGIKNIMEKLHVHHRVSQEHLLTPFLGWNRR